MKPGSHQTPEAIAKIRAANMGSNNPNFGKHPSEKTKAKQRAAKIGKHLSGETKAKQRAASIGNKYAVGSKGRTGQKHSPETLAKLNGPNNHQWRGGISREPYGWEWSAELKEEVRRRDGCKCQLCGVPQAECKQALTVHHINYNKRDNDPLNLVALCHTCHSRTNHRRTYWEGIFLAQTDKRAMAEKRT